MSQGIGRKRSRLNQEQVSGLLALGICAFAIGTTEFIAVGLVPLVAESFQLTVAKAGSMVSLYAVGVAIGAPVLTYFGNALSRKRLIAFVMITFIAGNLLAFLSYSFEMLVSARLITGLAHGVFLAVGSTLAASLVSKEKQGFAIALVFVGLTAAIVSGVPLGTYASQSLGWEKIFFGISLLGVAGLLGVAWLLPGKRENKTTSNFNKGQLNVFRSSDVLKTLAVTVFAYGGTFVPFTYFSVLLVQEGGFQKEDVSLMLLGYGISMALGNLIGGRLSDGNTKKVLSWLLSLQAVNLVVLTLVISWGYWAIPNLMFMGALGFANVPALQNFIVQKAEEHQTGLADMASALNIAAFNVGVAIASALGGVLIESSLGLKSTPLAGAVFVVMGFIFLRTIKSSN